MNKQNLTFYSSNPSTSSKQRKKQILNKARIILLFNLYDNRLVHEKFLDQIFENLIENKQMIRYDFQKKVYSLYPSNDYTNLKILNKLKVLSSIGLICLLLRYIRYKKLIYENFIFLKMYLKLLSKVLTVQLSIVFLILRKNLHFSKIKIYRTYKVLNSAIIAIYKILTFNYLDYKAILNKKLSITNYKQFYNQEIN
jgi:hypothetical protein